MENTNQGSAAYDLSFIPEQDRAFFESWEKGEVHLLSAILRVRQMYRASALPQECQTQTLQSA